MRIVSILGRIARPHRASETKLSRIATHIRNKMRHSKTCPKCQNTDIIRIPGEVRAFGAGNNITVGATIFSAAKVARYLCACCGFSEEWVESVEDIATIAKKYRV